MLSGTKMKVSSRQIWPRRTRAQSKYRNWMASPSVIRSRKKAMTLPMTMYSMRLGTPKLGCRSAKRSTALFSFLKSAPSRFEFLSLKSIIPRSREKVTNIF